MKLPPLKIVFGALGAAATIIGVGFLLWRITQEIPPLPSTVQEQTPPSTQDEVGNWQVYRNEENGFEVKYPLDYSLRESTENKSVVVRSTENQFIAVRIANLGLLTDANITSKNEYLEQIIAIGTLSEPQDIVITRGERSINTIQSVEVLIHNQTVDQYWRHLILENKGVLFEIVHITPSISDAEARSEERR